MLFLDNFIAFFFPRLINLIYTLLQTGFFFFFFLRNFLYISTPYKSILSMILLLFFWFVYHDEAHLNYQKFFFTHIIQMFVQLLNMNIFIFCDDDNLFSSIIPLSILSTLFFWPVCIFLVKYLLRSRINNQKFRVCHKAEGITHQKKKYKKISLQRLNDFDKYLRRFLS